MIIMDGTRYDVLGRIPYYRELKKEAVFFSQLITYAPYTLASLYAIFSGIYGYKNGVNGYYKAYSFDKKNCYTLAQHLKDAGYYTEADFLREDVGPIQGFDKPRSHDEFNEDLLIRHSEILTQIKNKKPFFLFLHYSKIHANLITDVAKKYSDFDEEYFGNKEKNFSTFLEWAKKGSEYLKEIIQKIKSLGLYENSIILVLSDHGSSVGDRVGEKMYGSYLYDYTIRCFLYILGKGFSKNMEIKNLVRNIDILPTILDILKIKQKSNYKKIQGRSFLPFIEGKGEERIAYSETGGLGGPTPSPEIHNVQCIRTNEWKLIYNKTNKKKELYNLIQDKEEKNNLIGKKPEIERYLWEEMQRIKDE
ncbi:MAG: sulfatase [Candidatus Thorarchaeota archaeon]